VTLSYQNDLNTPHHNRLPYDPDENHWVLTPQNSIQWHEEVMGWLTRRTE